MRALNNIEERRIAHMKRQVGRWSGDSSPLLGPPGPIWTSNGDLIVADYDPATATGSLVQLSMDGRRTAIVRSQGVDHYLYPRLSPDGKTLAYVRYTSHRVGEIFTMPLTGGTPKQLTKDSKTIQGLSWSLDGSSLLFSSNRKINYQLWSILAVGGDPVAVPTNSTSATDPVYTPDGNIIFVDSRENWNIWRRSLEASGSEQRIIASSGRNYDPRYSPDGRQIAFVSDRSGTMELWLADADGGSPKQLTHMGGTWLGGIAWSPDGRTIAFDARTGQQSAIYLISDGKPHLVEKNHFEERMPAWSQDGKTLYFNSNRDGELAICSREISTGRVQKIISHGMFMVANSGDKLFLGTRIGTLWESDLTGGHLRQLASDVTVEPVMSWFVRNRSLYFTRDVRDSQREIDVLSPAGAMTRLGFVHGPLVPNAPDITLSPDGRFLLFAEQDAAESDLKLRKR